MHVVPEGKAVAIFIVQKRLREQVSEAKGTSRVRVDEMTY